MERFYLFDYIKKNSNIDEDILDCLKYELDQRIYYYGSNFISPKERIVTIKSFLRAILDRLDERYNLALKLLCGNRPHAGSNCIISNSYFSINDELKKIGYNVYQPVWSGVKSRDIIADPGLYLETAAIKDVFTNRDFAYLIGGEFLEKIKRYKVLLKGLYAADNISALIVPNDTSFFEKLSLKIFDEVGKPSFIFLHGLPGIYNSIDDNGARYLIVWGDKIKENYVKAGIAGEKILVSGHPYYKTFRKQVLRSGLEDILIITKAMSGGQFSDRVRVSDRGNPILYLYSIQNILEGIGVKSVRLRAHPSENRKWYSRFIDTDFFKFDLEALDDSIKRSTLVIGPTSTLLLESVYYGVNYLTYEPSVNDIDLLNFILVPPFDGSDERVPVAKSEGELGELLIKEARVDGSFFADYVKTPFDISIIKKFIGDK